MATNISSNSNQSLLAKKGLIIHPLTFKNVKGGGQGFLTAFINIFFVINKVKPDILHLVTIIPVLLGGLVARLLKVPAVVYAISGLGYVFMSTGFKAAFRKWIVIGLYRIAFNHSRYFAIFQNEDDLELMSKYCPFVEKNAVLIKGSGVNLNNYKMTSIPKGIPVVTMVARLLKDKGVYEFINAARIIKKQFKAVEFWLVGDLDVGNPTSITEEDIEMVKACGNVYVLGYRSDIASIYAMSSIAVLPSYREGLPKSLVEAAACGRPIVTTDVPGCRDVVVDKVTGLLVPQKDSAELASSILELLNSPSRMREMGKRGRNLAEKSFSIEGVVNKHLKLYESLSRF